MKNIRLALVLSVSLAGSALSAAYAQAMSPDLDQGWDQQQISNWFDLSQGSRFLPLAWVQALEAADSTNPLLGDATATSLGFAMRDNSAGLHLPRGLTVDQQDDSSLKATKLRWKQGQGSQEPWLGLTCGACHTSQITYQGVPMTVYGGQTMGDFSGLLRLVSRSMRQTITDPDKFDRFAHKVLAAEYNSANVAMLHDALQQRSTWLDQNYQVDNIFNPGLAPLAGPGRLDAIGQIYSVVLNAVQAPHPVIAVPDAPVSYPFLWNVPQLDRVQWTGFAANRTYLVSLNGRRVDVTALARNVGEVTGVFGDVNIVPQWQTLTLNGYASAAQLDNLITFEQQLGKLRAPAWPTQLFGTPDPTKVAQGKTLYQQNCASCHTPLDRADLRTPINTTISRLRSFAGQQPIGTDPLAACNSTAPGYTGLIQGLPLPVISLGGTGQIGFFGDHAYTLDMLLHVVLGQLLNKKGPLVLDAIKSFAESLGDPPQWPELDLPIQQALNLLAGLGTPAAQNPATLAAIKAERLAQCMSIDTPLLGYKARPLNGVWASAPFLHNGSVPTLYDLLLPPSERPKQFYVGNLEYDPVKVGYVTTAGTTNTMLFDTSLSGNSNAGHDYGNSQFSEAQRQAIVEYMKTL